MPEEQTPQEKLDKANDDYHEAFDELMQDESISSETKAQVGNTVRTIFVKMTEVRTILNNATPEE